MPEKLISDAVEKMLSTSWLIAGVLATFGAVANYVFSAIHKKTPFGARTLFGTAFLGFFLGTVIHSSVDPSFAYRDSLLMIAGFLCYPILGILESQVPKMIVDKISHVFKAGPEK